MKKNLLSSISIFIFLFFITVYDSKGDTRAIENFFLKEGTKINLNNEYYFKYNFNKKPALGTVILRIQVFDKNDKQVNPFNISGEADMPSMRGMHNSGLIEFKLNKKNDYLLPVNIVMPGDWDVRIIIQKDNKEVFKGTIEFNV